jgi:hypothetical protein
LSATNRSIPRARWGWARCALAAVLAGGIAGAGAATQATAAQTTAAHGSAAQVPLAPVPAAQPAVTGISPTHGPEAGGTNVTITGAGLTGATAVTFGTTPGLNVIVENDTTVVATAPPHGYAIVDVTVTTAAGTSATSSADRYTYDEPAPAVTGISPAYGPQAGGTSVTVTGVNLASVTAVMFGSVNGMNVIVENDNTITATAPPHAQGTVDVTVTSPTGTSGTSSADRYTYAYAFSGFLPPVANPPAVNAARAGHSVSVQFSLGGNYGTAILAPGYPAVQQVNCNTGTPIGPSTPAGTAGNSGLQYNKAVGTYTFTWKTTKAFAGTCQVFTLGLNDGTFHTANFQFAS